MPNRRKKPDEKLTKIFDDFSFVFLYARKIIIDMLNKKIEETF